MPYAITTRDGITIQNIPDDVPPDSPALKDRVASLRAQKQPDMASMQAGLTQPAGAVERFITGAGAPIVGLGQLAARPLAAAGQVLESVAGPTQVGTFLQELPARNDQVAQGFQKYRRSIAPEGVDLAGTAGEIAATIPLALAGGVPATTAQLARAGAIAGGLTGAVQPVESDSFASEKAAQVGIGAAAGGVLSPVIAAALKPAVAGAQRAFRSVSNAAAGKTPEQIALELKLTLNNEGINVGELSDAYIRQRAADIKRALDAGQPIDDAMIAREAAAKSLKIDLTRGQVTQEPIQFASERALAQAPGGEQLAGQYTGALSQLRQSIENVGKGLPDPQIKVDAGTRIVEAARAADAPVRARVTALYDAAKNSIGRESPVDGRTFVDKTFTQLEKDLRLREVPGDIRNLLNTVSRGQELTIGRAEEVIQALNSRIYDRATSDSQRGALLTIKRNLDDAIESTGLQAGDDTAKAFRQARTASAMRAKKFEAMPTLKKYLDDELAPDDFIDRVVYRTPRDEFKATRAYLRGNNRDAWSQLRSQVLDDIRQSATRGSDNPADFTGAGFRKSVDRLRKSGKLGLIFSESEIRTLNAIGNVSRAIQDGPPGVIRTGFANSQKAAAMLTGLITRLTPAGAIVGSALQRGGNVIQATQALRPATVAAPSILPPSTVPARVAAPAASATIAPNQ